MTYRHRHPAPGFLICHVSGRKTGIHFCWTRSRKRQCLRSIRCGVRETATRRGSPWRSSASPYRLVEIDILRGESHTPEFLAKNPNGQVPLLEVAPGRYLAESNAILWYIAGGSALAPEDRMDRADAMQWMFFEQHSLEPNIGAAYFWLTLVKGGRDLQQHAIEDWLEEGHRALGVMEKASRAARLLCCRSLHHRRHRALRLHPRRASVRLRSHGVSGDPRVAHSRRLRTDHVPMDLNPAAAMPAMSVRCHSRRLSSPCSAPLTLH